jgi:hypothetical protein
MRFTLPDDKKLTHEMVIPIRWGDMDAMGHVNNTIYFRYLEIVRLEWLYKVGAAANPSTEQGPLIVNAFCNFEIASRQFVLESLQSCLSVHMCARFGVHATGCTCNSARALVSRCAHAARKCSMYGEIR